MDRRDFIKHSVFAVAATAVANQTKGANLPMDSASQEEPERTDKLIISAPMLQNFAETSIGVAFAVSDMANGFVTYSEHPDMSNSKTVKCGGYRVTDMNDKVMLVRLTNLKPQTTYYYRIGADRISYKSGYSMSIQGHEDDANVYHFTTAGPKIPSHFCVINDTHAHMKAMDALTQRIAQLAPSCVVWNGDACNSEETIDSQVRIFLKPQIQLQDYAANRPYLFCPGNHDNRGMANRHLERVWMFRQPEERDSRFWDLGRNFAVRVGDIALVGLDTAEDKMDSDKRFAGLFASDEYRRAQAEWLKEALQQPEIAKAPFLVALCHIPIANDSPRYNPGDVPVGSPEAKQYPHDYAIWQRTCAQLWGPLLNKAKCQLVICAHQHFYHYLAPDKSRTWGCIVGGGYALAGKRPVDNAILLDVQVQNHQLVATAYNMFDQSVLDTQTYLPKSKTKLKKAYMM